MIQNKNRKAQKGGKKNKNTPSNTTIVVNKVNKSKPVPRLNFTRDAWLATLIDPWGVHGVRIPDETVSPSATASIRVRFSVAAVQNTTATGKYAASVYFNPCIRNAYMVATGYDASNGSVSYPTPQTVRQDMPGYDTLKNLARSYRVVSAGFAVYSSTAMAQNQGRHSCAFYPGNDNSPIPFATTFFPTVGGVQLSENSEVSALNQQMVCSVVWIPSDRTNYQYHLPGSSPIGPTEAAPQPFYNCGTILWISDGLSSAATFEVSLVVNIEYLPNQNSVSFISQMPSRYDVLAMERALNSSLLSKIFGTAEPEQIMTSTASSDLGWASVAGQLASNFGHGVTDFLQPYSRSFGRAVARASLGYIASRSSRTLPIYRGLMGVP